jgi:hypothetical protein
MPYGEPLPYLSAYSGRLTLLLPGIDDFASLHGNVGALALGICQTPPQSVEFRPGRPNEVREPRATRCRGRCVPRRGVSSVDINADDFGMCPNHWGIGDR